MRKIYTLIVLLILGCSITWGNSYTVKITDNAITGNYLRPTVSPSGGAASISMKYWSGYSYSQKAAATASSDAEFPDKTKASDLFAQPTILSNHPVRSFDMSRDATGSGNMLVGLDLTAKIQNMVIYFTAPNGEDEPTIVFEGLSDKLKLAYEYGGNSSYSDGVRACMATVVNASDTDPSKPVIEVGSYDIYVTKYLGGLAGMKFEDTSGGKYVDMFSERTISDDRKTSTWTYGGYYQNTHGLCGGVEDNEIIYISSEIWGTRKEKNEVDNTNGNITFSLREDKDQNDETKIIGYTPFLSVQYESWVYIPVPANSTGTIYMTSIQTEKDRCFVLQADDGTVNQNDDKKLTMTEGASIKYTASDITNKRLNSDVFVNLKNPDATYIRLRELEYVEEVGSDKKMRDANELKISGFKVVLDDGYSYNLPLIQEDYEHTIPGDHTHAVFNYTEAKLEDTTKDSADKLTTAKILINKGAAIGTLLQGVKSTATNEDGLTSKLGNTDVIGGFRNGDLIKYKDSYYGGIQMISRDGSYPTVTYTLKAPEGYYFTTSVRLHGYRNIDYDFTETDADKKVEKSRPVEVAKLNYGKFSRKYNTDSECDFYRNDKNARTTTLDFEIPASTVMPINFGNYQMLGVIDVVLTKKTTVGLPSEKGHMYYSIYSPGYGRNIDEGVDLTDESKNNRIKYTVGEGYTDERKGTIEFYKDEVVTVEYPNLYPDEVLYWYFEPEEDYFAKKGTIEIIHNTIDSKTSELVSEPLDPADLKAMKDKVDNNRDNPNNIDFGIKDDNVTKTFGVRNLRFVSHSGEHTTDDDHLIGLYGLTSRTGAPAKKIATLDDQPTAVEDQPTTENTPLKLTITKPGTLYYYSNNIESNLNGPLVMTVFTTRNLTGVEDVVVEEDTEQDDANAPVYNVYGQIVDSSYRGIVIKNGRKYYQR